MIPPGHGALTGHLLEAGARVIALEPHPGRARRLRERYGGRALTVVQADASSSRLPRRPFRVVANPPYSITSPLLRRLLASRSRLVAADLVLQRAVVRRVAAERAASGRWDVRFGRSLPRRALRPPPKVDSAVLVVRCR